MIGMEWIYYIQSISFWKYRKIGCKYIPQNNTRGKLTETYTKFVWRFTHTIFPIGHVDFLDSFLIFMKNTFMSNTNINKSLSGINCFIILNSIHRISSFNISNFCFDPLDLLFSQITSYRNKFFLMFLSARIFNFLQIYSVYSISS